MIGLTILAIIVGYIFLSKLIINNVYKKFGTKKVKYIATVIMVLIPTWDIIISYPVYKYLCLTKAGIHVYKSVDNVEGFYIGERRKSLSPHEPYKGYKYIDYKEVNNRKSTGKYYRSYWIDYHKDTHKSQYCVYPGYPNSLSHPYTKAFNNGKCIIKEEIQENEVSRWAFERYKIGSETNIPIFNIDRVIVFQFIDREKHKVLGELIEYSWGVGWINNLLRYVARSGGFRCSGISRKSSYEDLYIKILKPKK